MFQETVSASKPGVAAGSGERGKTKRCGVAVGTLVFETHGRLGGEGTKLLRELATTAAANVHCSLQAAVRLRTHLERLLLSAQADTYLRALGSRVGAMFAGDRPDAGTFLSQAVLSARFQSVPSGVAFLAIFSRRFVRQRDRETEPWLGCALLDVSALG